MNKALFIDVLLFVVRMLVVFIVNIDFVDAVPDHEANFKLISFRVC